MLQPKTMTRLLIVGSKEQMSSAVTELYRHHVFHITDYTDQGAEGYEGFRIGQPMAGATELSTNLISIRSIENTFDISPDAYIGIPNVTRPRSERLLSVTFPESNLRSAISRQNDPGPRHRSGSMNNGLLN